MENYESYLPPIFWSPSLIYVFLCKYIANFEDYDTALYAILQYSLLNRISYLPPSVLAYCFIPLSTTFQKQSLLNIHAHVFTWCLPNVYFQVIQIKIFNSYVICLHKLQVKKNLRHSNDCKFLILLHIL